MDIPFKNKTVTDVTAEQVEGALAKNKVRFDVNEKWLKLAIMLQQIAENNYDQCMHLVECCELIGYTETDGFYGFVHEANGDFEEALKSMAISAAVKMDMMFDIMGTEF
jgi:hypothetical protein